jgi:acyl transferase domain-containing protein
VEDPSILCATKTDDQFEALQQSTVARIICVSGKDQKSAAERRKQLLAYLKAHCGSKDLALSDFAFTLNHRRSVLPWRNYAIGRTIDDLVESLESPASQATKSHQGPLRIGMVFTGQGAQWAAMGKELLHEFPIYRQSMEECEQHLYSLGARWSLVGKPGLLLFPSAV